MCAPSHSQGNTEPRPPTTRWRGRDAGWLVHRPCLWAPPAVPSFLLVGARSRPCFPDCGVLLRVSAFGAVLGSRIFPAPVVNVGLRCYRFLISLFPSVDPKRRPASAALWSQASFGVTLIHPLWTCGILITSHLITLELHYFTVVHFPHFCCCRCYHSFNFAGWICFSLFLDHFLRMKSFK